jgi:glycerophosphoryl diester phosphodiesterase
MMEIISHRGFWVDPQEKNQRVAFERSFSGGYGTETDVRDCMGRLVVSHDPPTGKEIEFEELLVLSKRCPVKSSLALNIKADGLSPLVARALAGYDHLRVFVFDMSIPDMRSWLASGIPTFARLSEVEKTPAWRDRSAGIWLDGFQSVWYQGGDVLDLLRGGKQVCIVSEELHGRDPSVQWQMLKQFVGETGLVLCTDRPTDATKFFGIK